MAITQAGMKAAILAAINGGGTITDATKLADVLATGIVGYLNANLTIDPTTGTPPMTVLVAGVPTPVTGKGKAG